MKPQQSRTSLGAAVALGEGKRLAQKKKRARGFVALALVSGRVVEKTRVVCDVVLPAIWLPRRVAR